MKVAIVRGSSLNPFEMQYYEILQNKHQLTCFGSDKPLYELQLIKLPIIKLPCLGQKLNFPGAITLLNLFFGDPQLLLGLEKKITGFDLVHTAELYTFYTHQVLMAKEKGLVKKVMATVSENIVGNNEDNCRQKALKHFAISHLDHILAISHKSKQMLIKEGYPEKKIIVVPHGIDLQQFRIKNSTPAGGQAELRMRIKNSELKILFVGRLVKEKGIWELLNAVKELSITYPNIKLIMVGRGPEEREIRRWIKENGLDQAIELKGIISYGEMPSVYQQADIFVLPSKQTKNWQEQFGMVLLEAMACGLAIVTTKSGAIEETVGQSALLVPPGDDQELKQAIEQLIKNRQLAERLGRQGRQRAKNLFDRKKVAALIDRIYQKVIGTTYG